MKVYFLLLITIFTIFIFPQIAEARVSFSIFPEKFDLVLGRGDNYQGKIKVSNLSSEKLPLSIQIKNFSASDEKGRIAFEENDDVSFGASQWLKFTEGKFILQAKSFKEVEFNIRVPENAEPRGYYLTALFQSEISLAAGQSSAKILPMLGALFLIKIKGDEEKYPSLDKQFELVDLKVPPFVEAGPIPISFRLKNSDPVHIRVRGKMIDYNLFGNIREEININEQTILPGKIRLFELKTSANKFFDKFFLGPYRAELILSTQTWREKIGNDQQLVEEIRFFALPWKLFLVFLALIFLMIFIPRLIRKNKKISTNKQ